MLNEIIEIINNSLYSYILIALLIVGGIYFSVVTGFVQFRRIGSQFKAISEKPADKKGVSSFQALIVSTASRVGTGNIIVVSSAICLGGFGSVFWMWLIAIIGCASAYAESTLAQIFKKRGKEGCYGGPAYYIEALNLKPLAIVFTICLILTYGFGFNMLASYNLQSTFSGYDYYNETYTPWMIGGIIAVLVAFCLLGGGKGIIKVTEILVPVMGIAYVLVAIFVILININLIPQIFTRIFSEAFDLEAIFGGFSGSCIMYGIKRGLFSNEAGVGSAPNASSSAEVSHPAKQGLVQILSVFIDTLLISTATAFLCMCSGIEPTESIEGAQYVQLSLQKTLGSFGPVFITVAMMLFAFTTLLGNLYYVDKGINYLAGKELSTKVMNIIHILFSFVIFIGAGLNAKLLWNIADVTMGLMTLINVPVILILSKYFIRTTKVFDKQLKEGKNPTFKARDIGIKNKLDYWQ